jgi:hypothetical protein
MRMRNSLSGSLAAIGQNVIALSAIFFPEEFASFKDNGHFFPLLFAQLKNIFYVAERNYKHMPFPIRLGKYDEKMSQPEKNLFFYVIGQNPAERTFLSHGISFFGTDPSIRKVRIKSIDKDAIKLYS